MARALGHGVIRTSLAILDSRQPFLLCLKRNVEEINVQKVLVVGGGFGGVKAALELANDPNFNVTLLSDKLHFRYYPDLYHTATGGRTIQTSIPLQEIFDQRSVTLVRGSAKTLHRERKQLETEDGRQLDYDILILALGVVTNYFGINGLKEHAFGIKSVEEAERLKQHLHQQLLDEHKPDLNYIIIGAGPTGIELAGALPEYLRVSMERHGINNKRINVTVVEALPQLLPRFQKGVSNAVRRRLKKLGVKVLLGKKVEAETADTLIINGKPVKSHTVIWTAGVTNHPFFKQNSFTINERGKVIVNNFFMAEPDIYVIGDNANSPFSGLAQTAVRDGQFVANHLKRLVNHEAVVPYKPKQPVSVIPTGKGWAVVVWGSLHFTGIVGWLLREAADYVAFRELEPWWKAGIQWTTEFGEQEECPVCAKALYS